MRGVLGLAPALLVAACAGPAATAAPTPPASAWDTTYGVSVANGLTVPVGIYVNGAEVGTVAPGASQDWAPGTLPAKPWALEARSPAGRALADLTVTPDDYISGSSGRFSRADLACGRLDVWSGPQPMGPMFVPDPSRPCDGAASVDEARAGQIARDYFATAHGAGAKLTDVRETDLGITNDTACGASWEVLMEGTVTDSSGFPYGSHMYLCVDPTTGAVIRGPAG